jgi:hypothetical protein
MALRSCPVALLALVVAACGASKPDRFDQRTPGTHTGVLPAATLAPPPTATPTPKGKPKPKPKLAKVTRDERRVIKGWSDALRAGHVNAASAYFSIPSMVINQGQAFLTSRAQIVGFNRALPCGAKLLSARRAPQHAVVGTFRLTMRPGADCGTGVGGLAAVQFLVRRQKIIEWLRADDQIDPAIAAQPSPAPTPTASPTTP